MTDEELAEIERVWSAATPGPWRWRKTGDSLDSETKTIISDTWPAGYQDEATLEAIVKAPQHIAFLLAEVKRLRALAGD